MKPPSYTKQLKAAVKLARTEDPTKIGRVLIEGTPYPPNRCHNRTIKSNVSLGTLNTGR